MSRRFHLLRGFALDGMNGLVCEDDKQVVKLVIHKLFDSERGVMEGQWLR